MATWEELKNSALAATAESNFAAAEKAWMSARDEAEKGGPKSAELATSMLGLAQTYNAMGNFPEGEKWAQKATEMREELLGKNHSEVADCLKEWAKSHQ